VYVTVPGLLQDVVGVGERVTEGQRLAQLVNPELHLQVQQLRGQRDEQRVKLKNLELRQAHDPRVAARIPTAREALQDVENRLRQLEADEGRLVLRAPIAGTIIPPPQRSRPLYRENELDRWSGTPLDEENRGCFLDTGRLVCLLGDPDRLEVMLVIDQAHVKDVLAGQDVRIRLDQLPGRVMTGRIAEVSQAPLETAPPELALTNRLAVEMDEDGNPRPANRCYEARVTLDHVPEGLLTGTSGYAKIFATPRTLSSRFVRWLKRTFHFEL
jgi:putative peptide zinc metalloprotease protein